MNLVTIDSFINVPLLISAGIGLITFVLVLIAKLRNNVNISLVFYVLSVLLFAGSLYSYFTKKYFWYVVTVIVIGLIFISYLIILVLDEPIKKQMKKITKKNVEYTANKDANIVSKEVINQIEEKNNNILNMNRELISKLSAFFSSDNSLDNFLEYCNEELSHKINADGCVILMGDNYENNLAVKSYKGVFPPPYKLPDDLPHKPIRVETNLKFATFPLSGNIFGEIYIKGEPVYIPDSVTDVRIYQNGPEDFLKCGSYIFLPIAQNDEKYGIIALARLPGKDQFSKEDFENGKIFAGAVSMAMEPMYSFLAYAEHTELNKGGSIAAKYQKDLLPLKLPVISGITMGCFMNPAENVCGDLYDVVMSRKDRVSFILADVAGKGMNSLIVMIMIRAILRLAVHTAQTTSTIMSWANRGICFETSKIDHFASVTLINYDAVKKEIDLSTCGNNPVFIFKATDRAIKQVSIPSEPMGVSKDTEYTNKVIKLAPGDIVATCTDGLLESLNENGVQYSIESLKQVIIKNCKANAKDISNRVKDDLKKYCGIAQQYDDQSLLVIKIQ